MRARRLVKCIAFSFALAPAGAAAQPCAREGTRGPRLPLGVTVDAADLSTVPSPCGGATVSMEARVKLPSSATRTKYSSCLRSMSTAYSHTVVIDMLVCSSW